MFYSGESQLKENPVLPTENTLVFCTTQECGNATTPYLRSIIFNKE